MESEAAAPGKYRGLRAFGIIYLALTIAGTAASIDPGAPLARPLAVLLFIGLTALYMFGTAPGRQTSGKAYLLCALLCPLILVVLVFAALSLSLSYDAFTLIETLSSGFGVGFEIGGSETIPLWVSFLLWWLGIPTAMCALVGIRSLVRARNSR